MSCLPREIGRLSALIKLDVVGNQLTNLPTEIGQLTALKELNVWKNPIDTLPPIIPSCYIHGLNESLTESSYERWKKRAKIASNYAACWTRKRKRNEIEDLSALPRMVTRHLIGLLFGGYDEQ